MEFPNLYTVSVGHWVTITYYYTLMFLRQTSKKNSVRELWYSARRGQSLFSFVLLVLFYIFDFYAFTANWIIRFWLSSKFRKFSHFYNYLLLAKFNVKIEIESNFREKNHLYNYLLLAKCPVIFLARIFFHELKSSFSWGLVSSILFDLSNPSSSSGSNIRQCQNWSF